MNRIRTTVDRTLLIFAATACLAALFATSASAGTTVGYPLASATPEAWAGGSTNVQRRNLDDTGTLYTGFATGGVLTSVSIKTSGLAAGMDVSVLRKTGEPSPSSATFLSIGLTNIPVTADATAEGHVTSVLTRIPVNAGDRFAARTALVGTRFLRVFSASESDYCFYSFDPQLAGESLNYESSLCNNYIPLVEGNLEADADNDGYGDETQDLCPTDPTRFSQPCPVANLVIKAVKSNRKIGTSATTAFTVTNSGEQNSGVFVFTVKAAKSPKKLSIIKGCEPTAASKKRSCSIAGLAPGASITVRVKWTPKSALRVALTASVKSKTSESSLTDNKVKVTVKAKKPK